MTVTLQDYQKMLGLRIGEVGWRPSLDVRWVSKGYALLVLISWLRAKFAQCPSGANDQTI
jgi:hypothetical protein